MAAGFERLRLEMDREWDGPMPLHKCGFVRNYAAELFGHTSMMGELIQSRVVKDRFVRILYESDFHEMAGRVLLLITREPVNEYTKDEPYQLMYYIESLDRISQALAVLPYPSHLSEVILADWFKVNSQIVYYHFGILHSDVPGSIYAELLDSWGPLLPKKLIQQNYPPLEGFQCSYPRCADPMVHARHPDVNSVCQRCGKARYCTTRCQQLHSALKTVDSHLVCR
ncbi:hypothetical protein RSOLAG1IB_05095 [Rhizoctonia solani AG-1 IB]|uniref:MYND-type domain-containing protein n=1 Tax=Thanatephorus cucumeris (strain AG1-IB / isolate 7/3/14) TaxID=1108050 RepID=A0A0B7G2M5_THACB|nr:hypothetical protein RSOLAG1IB_05095 [Rhizoctonia solani AG-1 IB]